MITTNNLKWEAEVSDKGHGKEWVTVTPYTGFGDTNVSINIQNTDVYASEEDLVSEVTFRCVNCDLIDESYRI